MNTRIMTIFTRTPLHVGCGSSVGAVDQPVARERHTRFPIIPGSAIKGVLADLWVDWSDKDNPKRSGEGKKILGDDSKDSAKAGSLLVGEGKLLAFPVRSAKNCFAWITCPFVLRRFAADTKRNLAIPEVEESKVFAPSSLMFDGTAIFEEYPLASCGGVSENVADAFSELVSDPIWNNEVKNRLAIVSDEMFAYFAENACEIANHNRIDDASGVVAKGALFSQENIPSETMFYAVFNSRTEDDFEKLQAKLEEEKNLLQSGADMTTGLGWCTVAMKEVK